MAKSGIPDKQLKQLTTANKVALSALDIDGATAIGAALADADLFIVDDGAGGTNRKITAATMQDYFSSLDVLETSVSANYQILFADDNTDTPYSESSSAVSTSRVQGSTLSSSTTSILFSPELGVSLSSGAILGFKDSSGNRLAFTVSSSAASEATSITVSHLSAASTVSSLNVSSLSSIVNLTAGSAGSGDGKVRVDGSGLLYNPSTDLLTVGGDISVGDDILMASDGAVLSLGAGADVSLTHVHDTGLLLNDAMQLQFRDSDIHISSDADGYLSAQADTGVNINIGGTDELAITSAAATFGGNIVIPDAGNIGSASDSDAMAISSAGVVTFSQRDVHNAGITIANAGQIGSVGDADAMAIAADGVVTFSQRDVHSAGITVADGATIGSETTAGAITIAANGKITLAGDLEVQGNTTTVDTANLLVEDPVILLASGASSSDQNGGIVIEKGGSSTDEDMVFGRVAADTWGVGTLDTSGGTATSLASMSPAGLRSSKLEVGSSSDHIEMSGGNLVVTAGTTSADIVFAAAGSNVKPSADSSVSLGQQVVSSSSLDSSASSFSAFQASRLQSSSFSSSTTSFSFSPEAGFTASSGEVVIFSDGSDTLAFTFDSDVASSATSASVSHNSSNSTTSLMNKSSIAEVTRKQITTTTTGAAWANLYVDNIDLDGQGRIDLDDDQDTSIRASADDVISIEIGGSDKLTVNASAIAPTGAAGMDLGTSALGFNDLHLDSGGVVNFDGGNVTMTHSSGQLAVSDSLAISDHDGSSVGLKLGSTLVTASAAELNVMDGDTSATSTTLVAADRLVVNDAGSMVQVAMSDLATLLKGDGLKLTGATLSIDAKKDVFQQSDATSGNTVCTLNFEPVSQDSVDVYLNGVLQLEASDVSSGSDNDDYTYGGSSGSRTITFTDALLSEDVVVVKYIAKSE